MPGEESPSLFKDRPLLMLFDGDAVAHRAYHALEKTHLSVKKTGEPTGAVFGFINTLLKAIADLKPTHCAVAFDRPTPTFRHIQYEEYKAQRPRTPEELVAQLQRIRQVVEALSIPIYEIDGYEADDVLGTLSRQASQQDTDVVIYTGDTDTMQLVSPHISVYLWNPYTGKATLYNEAGVRERYGLNPNQIADLKALQGDTSDNIPGVPGIGEKTAVRLLQEFQSVKGILANLDKIGPPKTQETLRANQERANLCIQLTTIETSVPITLDLDASAWGNFEREKVLEIFREMEFNSLLGRLPQPKFAKEQTQGQMMFPLGASPQAVPSQRDHGQGGTDYHPVQSFEELDALVAHLRAAPAFAFDVESTSLKPTEARLVGVSISAAPGVAWYIPLGHITGVCLPPEESLARLKPLLEDPKKARVAHNGGYDISVLANHGVRVPSIAFDTMIAAHLLNEKSIGLKPLAFSKLGVEMTPIEALIGKGSKQVTMAQVGVEEVYPYACADADMTLRLKELFEPDLKAQSLWELFTQVEMPLLSVLVAIERNGVALDISRLQQMSRELGEQIASLEASIYNTVGHQFNINSPQQLSGVLYEELKLPKPRRTKTGYSTDAQVIEDLKKKLRETTGAVPEILKFLLEYRELTKLKSTYIDALPKLVNPRTHRVHTSFNQAGTDTGRFSSSDPNLQNIPVRTDLGRKVREAFIAPAPDWVLLSADYSQIELRILAHMSQDKGLLEAFWRGEDIHRATASQVYGVPLDQVTPEMRRFAKVVNFGILYGMSEYGLSARSELTVDEASPIINSYFQKYPGIRKYLDETRRFARSNGYVQTMLGRKRYIPEINSPNFQVRQAAERKAVNMPIQGTAADIIKVAMINIQNRIESQSLRTRMTLQVHDELIFEVPKEELGQVKALVEELMPQMPEPLKLSVPLKIDTKTGPNWGELE